MYRAETDPRWSWKRKRWLRHQQDALDAIVADIQRAEMLHLDSVCVAELSSDLLHCPA